MAAWLSLAVAFYCLTLPHTPPLDTGGEQNEQGPLAALAMLRDNLHLNVRGVDASGRFLNMLAGVTDPEKKRKLIGNEFIRVFEEEAQRIGSVDFLVQGTLYPDVIESVSVKGP